MDKWLVELGTSPKNTKSLIIVVVCTTFIIAMGVCESHARRGASIQCATTVSEYSTFTIYPPSHPIIIGSNTNMSIQTADCIIRHLAKQHDCPRCQQQVAFGYFMIIVDGQILLTDDRDRTNINYQLSQWLYDDTPTTVATPTLNHSRSPRGMSSMQSHTHFWMVRPIKWKSVDEWVTTEKGVCPVNRPPGRVWINPECAMDIESSLSVHNESRH
jgi:hypothetical protein